MTPLPKRRLSSRRGGKREAALKKNLTSLQKCPKCGAIKRSHRICPKCGYYNQTQLIVPKATPKKDKK